MGSPKIKVQRNPQSGRPGTEHSGKEWGQRQLTAAAVGQAPTITKGARRAQSLSFGLCSHCQQLPKESSGLKHMAHGENLL